MRTAILFTGQERSLDRCIQLLRKNLLEPNQATVFLACESDNPTRVTSYFDGIEIGGVEILPSFRTDEFNKFIELLSVCARPALLQKVFDRTKEGWSINYVIHSGTVVQYYQVWKAWLQVLEYEKKHGIQFDVVVRCRPDCLLTEKLDLSNLTTEGDELICRSMGNERILENIKKRGVHICYEHPIGSKIANNVVWTLGFEQIWFAKRKTFALLGPMFFSFGCWDSGELYAFNSESFFHEFCKANHITHWGYLDTDQTDIFNYTGEQKYVFSILR